MKWQAQTSARAPLASTRRCHMETPTTRQELRARRREAERREYAWLIAATVPALILLVLPKFLGRRELLPDMNKVVSIGLIFAFLAWIFFVLLGPYRWV